MGLFVNGAEAEAAVAVKSIYPFVGRNNSSVNITSVTGSGFVSGASVKLTKSGAGDVACAGFTFDSSTILSSGTCNITGVSPGNWNVVITNPDLQTGALAGGMTISEMVIGGLISTTFDTRAVNGVNFN